MGNTRQRYGILVGLGVAAGAVCTAAVISTTTAPTARADDFTDVINAVDTDYADGQAAFTTAFTDFSSSDLAPGLAALYDGVNDDALSAPDNLLAGTVEVLTNEIVTAGIPWNFTVPADFSDAVTAAEALFASGEVDLTNASDLLSLGDFGPAGVDGLIGVDLLTVAPLEELLLGAAVSF